MEDLIKYILLALPAIFVGIGVIYFVTTKKDWKDKIAQLVFMVVERVKDGNLTWDEAYEILKWIFEAEPSETDVKAELIMKEARKGG